MIGVESFLPNCNVRNSFCPAKTSYHGCKNKGKKLCW